jgi:hypothetical protein
LGRFWRAADVTEASPHKEKTEAVFVCGAGLLILFDFYVNFAITSIF